MQPEPATASAPPSMNAFFYAVPSGASVARIKTELRKAFTGIAETRTSQVLEVFDSFDWRLWGKNRLLVKEEGAYLMVDLQSDGVLASAAAVSGDPPRFWWEWADSAIKAALKEALDVRALIRRLKVVKSVLSLNLLNPDRKIVARVLFLTMEPKDPAAGPLKLCKLVPVRGYFQKKRQAAGILSRLGMTPLSGHELAAALKHAGLEPGLYSTKPSLDLDGQMPAGNAARAILAHLLGVMRVNEEGICRDIDSEFLHDFRVSVRRSRSLLSLCRSVFDPARNRSMRNDLRLLGKASNELRDLDVYLLQQPNYEQLLPEPLRPSIASLFSSLKRRRKGQAAGLCRYLGSARYRRIVERMEKFCLLSPPAGAPERESMPVADLARELILRRYRKVVKNGRMIDPGSPDAQLHRLRIECKKLRYALEFFFSLFPAQEMTPLVAQLKALQDYLGRYNDLSVQQRFLLAFLNGIQAQKDGLGLAAATGGLIGALYAEQRQMRALFPEAFGRFDHKENKARYKTLFSAQETGP